MNASYLSEWYPNALKIGKFLILMLTFLSFQADLKFPAATPNRIITMKFSASEKAAVLSIMAKISPKAGDLGAEVLQRLLIISPEMKKDLHFDLTPGSADLKTHGAKIMNSLANAANHMDNLADNLSSLSDLRTNSLRVDPGNFILVIKVIMDSYFQRDLTPEVQASWNKFIGEVFKVLTSEDKSILHKSLHQ